MSSLGAAVVGFGRVGEDFEEDRRIHDGVAIVGCGTIGLFAVAIARAMGANYVIGVEPMENHAEMARRLGADVVLRPQHTSKDRPHASDPELTVCARCS